VFPIYGRLVEYEDRISVHTPEGVTLDVPLAGVGSRFVAQFVDQVIQWSVLLALFIGLTVPAALLFPEDDAAGAEGILALGIAVFLLAVFVVQFGYHVAFETWGAGRTPGKRWAGLRVVKEDGAPVDFTSSAVRNLLRLVDGLPFAYLVGIVAVLASAKNQRLGDMTANTIVVRERIGGRESRRERKQRAAVPMAPVTTPAPEALLWDVSGVTAEEVTVVRRYLERRPTLQPEARMRLAAELAAGLRPKVVGPDEDMSDIEFLTELVAVKFFRSGGGITRPGA
jgi:uncharacterized RDD family membrane protein YckC